MMGYAYTCIYYRTYAPQYTSLFKVPDGKVILYKMPKKPILC
jgi:hypothetical protein